MNIDRAFNSLYVDRTVNARLAGRKAQMAKEILVVGPIRPYPRSSGPQHREREESARAERRERAVAVAVQLFSRAADEPPTRQPVWVRAVTLLMETIQADYGTVMVVRGPEARRCRITRGRGLEPTRPTAFGDTSSTPAPLVIERLAPPPSSATIATPPVPRATASFHSLLYLAEDVQPIGCLSIHSSSLALAPDRVALIHAVAGLLASELARAPLPDPTPV
jgi:hypothetical protein